MKIVLVQDYLRSGGTERQTVLLANAFEDRGHQSSVLSFRPGGLLKPTLRAPHAALQPFDTGLDWWAPRLLPKLRQLAPDIVLCMGRMANCAGPRILRGLRGSQVLATMRTGKAIPTAYARFLTSAHHVICNSNESAEAMAQDHGVQRSRLSTIANSMVFRTPAGDEERRGTRQEQGAGPSTVVLLNVGMFRPEKQQRELIELCTLLPRDLDWQLWLAGDGPELSRCVHLAGELNLSSRIRFLGWQADPASIYAGADLAVHASTTESLSNFLIEAQGAGLPCVAYAARGNRECMVPGRTGHVIPKDDRQGFCAAICELASEDSEARAVRSRLARAHALANFDEARQVDAYLRLFHSLCANK